MKLAEKFTAAAASLQRQVEDIRQQIAATVEEIQWLATSPAPLEEIKEHVAAAVAHTGAKFLENARLGELVHRGDVAELFEHCSTTNVIMPDTPISGVSTNLAPMMCWLMPAQVTARICAAIDSGEIAFEPGPPISERAALVEAAHDRLSELESQEEELVCEAEDAGVDITRRADANPEIILGAYEAHVYRFKAVPVSGDYFRGEVESDEMLTRDAIETRARHALPHEWLAQFELEQIEILETLDSEDILDASAVDVRNSNPPRSRSKRKRVFYSKDMAARTAEKDAITKAINSNT